MIHARKVGIVVVTLLAMVSCASHDPVQAKGPVQEKKLINFGWDMKNIHQLAADIDKLQDLPFDGLCIRDAWCYPFYSRGLTGDPVERMEIAKKIKWGRFTDNFMYMTAGKKVDWFDDKLWADDGEIMKNIRALAKIGGAAGCKGILFDPEFVYWGQGQNTWKLEHQKRYKEKTLEEFEAMVRKRGVQVINAIEEYMPDTVFLTLFWGSMGRYAKAAKVHDPKLYREVAREDYYGLLNAFMCGILEGADLGTRIIDGNEHSYYNTKADDYWEVRKLIKEDVVKTMIPDDLKEKYRRQVQCGHAVYSDHLSNTQSSHNKSTYLTPPERAKWMEHNVYWALKTSDHYVWFYTEQTNYLRHQRIPPMMIAAIERAKEKVAAGRPLGFDVTDMLVRAQAELMKAETRRIKPRSAGIPRLGHGAAPPKMDGKLDDPAWKKSAVLGPFMNFATAVRKELRAETEARMTFDDRALYIAVECKDPDMKSVSNPSFHESHVFWTADAVELVIATTPENKAYYHIKIGVNNKRWDSLTKTGYDIYGKDSSWTGNYTSATRKGPNAWTLEVAIPWSTLKMKAPKPGAKIRGNIVRRTHRWPDGIQELSSWSERRTIRCPEAEHFGTWIFE